MTRGTDLHRVAQTLTTLARTYPEARAHIDRNLAAQPWPTDTMPGYSSGGDISDPTAHAALGTWLNCIDQMDKIAHLIDRLTTKLDTLVRFTPALINGKRPEDEMIRCNGGEGMKGSSEWGRPECERNSVDGHINIEGLCDACRQRRDYWREKQKYLEASRPYRGGT